MTINDAALWLLGHDDYRIVTHRNPDGDTIGCAAALCRGLRSLGKRASVLDNPQFTPRYAVYLDGQLSPLLPGTATVLSVDMASEDLLPGVWQDLAGDIVFAIDHHGSNTGFAPDRLVSPDTAACGELIFHVLRAMGIHITPEIADCLYLAISTDTGCFQYSNTTASTLRVAAELKESGADTARINKIMFGTKSLPRLRLEARLTGSMELLAGGLVAICYLPDLWMAELGLSEDDIDSISGFPRSIEGVEISVMIRGLQNGGHKISMRTDLMHNASDLCACLGGGGHRAAAGATVDKSFQETREAVLGALRGAGLDV